MAQSEQIILVLQGGGALGAYQAGAYERLAEEGMSPDWVAGISIGAINAAIICGNPPEHRSDRLRSFWEGATYGTDQAPWLLGTQGRAVYGEAIAASVMTLGVPGFFRPRPVSNFWPVATMAPVDSVYDTSPLLATLEKLVDFDYLNDRGPRLSVGSVDVETSNFVYFDSAQMRIGPKHIMASGALPPGFPPVEIDGRIYWDGGLVSNTPLQFIMENLAGPSCIFQVDLFSARGSRPHTIAEVEGREKDVRFSSRTRLTTDRYRQLHAVRQAAERLAARLPDNLKNDPDLELLRTAGPSDPITLVELIHRKQTFEGSTKDYEFSRLSMRQHWAEGVQDVKRSLAHPEWIGRKVDRDDGLQVFDFGTQEVLSHAI